MLTTGSIAFVCSIAQVLNVIETAGLKCYLAPHWYCVTQSGKYIQDSGKGRYFMWQDKATGGGGCRVVFVLKVNVLGTEDFANDRLIGVAWISRHSGYPQADITEEVGELFEMIGCIPYGGEKRNPHIYPGG